MIQKSGQVDSVRFEEKMPGWRVWWHLLASADIKMQRRVLQCRRRSLASGESATAIKVKVKEKRKNGEKLCARVFEGYDFNSWTAIRLAYVFYPLISIL